jgi:hypothetical protein
MMRGQRLWLRLGDSKATAGDLTALEADLQAHRGEIAADMPSAEIWVGEFEVEQYVMEASDHSLQRIGEFLGKEGTP